MVVIVKMDDILEEDYAMLFVVYTITVTLRLNNLLYIISSNFEFYVLKWKHRKRKRRMSCIYERHMIR